MNLVVLLVVLPVAGRILMGYFGMSSIAKDILLTEFSGLAMIFGLLMIAVAFSPVIMAGGKFRTTAP